MRKHYNSLSGVITDNPLTSGATTMNSTALASLPAIVAPDYAAIVLDPTSSAGVPEIVWVMAHTASATSATIWRARESTTARQHLLGMRWVHGPTAYDIDIASQKYLYLPPGWDDTWVQARYTAGTTPAWITGIGESVFNGMNASSWLTGSYFGQMRTNLITTLSYPLYGDYYSAASSNLAVGSTPWTIGVVPLIWAPWSISGIPYYTGGPTNPLTFVSPAACTALDIVHADRTAGTWIYTIDGGANQTVTNTGAGLTRITLTGLSNAVHTILFKSQSADGVMLIDGIATYDPTNAKTKGLGFAKCGLGGMKMFEWTRGDQSPADRAKQWQGWNWGATPTGFGFPTQPSLFIIELSGNDLDATVVANAPFLADPETYAWGISRLCQAVRKGVKNASILIVAPCIPATGSGEMTTPLPGADDYYMYLDRMYDVAGEWNCGIVNINAKWGGTPIADGLITSVTDVHLTDAGHTDIAASVNSVVAV